MRRRDRWSLVPHTPLGARSPVHEVPYFVDRLQVPVPPHMSKKIEFLFATPAESPGYLLSHLTMLLQRRHKRVLDPLDLTQTQFVLMAALGWLSRTNDHVTQVAIAEQGNADTMMVSKVLRTLEMKKFITRQAHGTDTRAKTVKLTKHGARVLQQALVAVEHADLEFFAHVGKSLPSFNKHLAHLIERNKDLQ